MEVKGKKADGNRTHKGAPLKKHQSRLDDPRFREWFDGEQKRKDQFERDMLAPLHAGPVKIDDNDLIEKIEERLDALLFLFGCNPTPDGWRDLALQLALKHTENGKRVIDIRAPLNDQLKEGGRKVGKDQQKHLDAMNRIKSENPSFRNKDAAERYYKERKKKGLYRPGIGRLKNLWSEQEKRGMFPSLPSMMKINAAIDEAASRLENRLAQPDARDAEITQTECPLNVSE